MKAKVQYNDYCGTTAADRSDDFVELPEQQSVIIVKQFDIPVEAEEYQFIGVSVSGTKVNSVLAQFFFRNQQTGEIVKYYKYDVELQSILYLFKRFVFQVGCHLEDIDENLVKEIESVD